jgi:hypothetical protein
VIVSAATAFLWTRQGIDAVLGFSAGPMLRIGITRRGFPGLVAEAFVTALAVIALVWLAWVAL